MSITGQSMIVSHTPSPWHFGSGTEKTPAGVGSPSGPICKMPGSEPEDIANARLISAAPELLEALKALCAWSDHSSLTGLPHDAPVSDSAPSFDETVRMVHAAIAKAEGRS